MLIPVWLCEDEALCDCSTTACLEKSNSGSSEKDSQEQIISPKDLEVNTVAAQTAAES